MKKESKRHILSTVAVILAAVAAVTVLFVLHHKQQQEKARQPEESISQEDMRKLGLESKERWSITKTNNENIKIRAKIKKC